MDEKSVPFKLNEQETYLYALVDGALIENFYDQLAYIEKLQYKSLLAGTVDSASAPFGPILLALNPEVHTTLFEELLILQTQYATPVWLNTELTFVPLFNVLRDLLYVEREDGRQYFFRYYDWQCLASFLSIVYLNPYYAYTMKKISWAVWQPDQKAYRYYDKDKIGKAA